jgi:hypothetical protein
MAIVKHSLIYYPNPGKFAKNIVVKLSLALPGKVDYFG